MTDIVATAPLDDDAHSEIRLRLALDHQKWDSQIGDVEALGRFATVLSRQAWAALAETSEQLAVELAGIEREIARRPDLWSVIGLPKRLRDAFAGERPGLGGPRVVRFDFHPTAKGWALSEVNADVPGGFVEASCLPTLVAPHFPGARLLGDPAEVLVDAMIACARGYAIGLMVAPGHMEDMQVVTHLAARICRRGARAIIGHASAFELRDGVVFVHGERVGLVYRFYQAEWLAELDSFESLKWVFSGHSTPVVNPGVAAITESKRLPLAFRGLSTKTNALRAFLPETRPPQAADWLLRPEEWVVKGTYSNTGDAVIFPEQLSRRRQLALAARALAQPESWVLQRRFDVVPVSSPIGNVQACVGVYAIDGKVAGAYARVARSRKIDAYALDVACLVEA